MKTREGMSAVKSLTVQASTFWHVSLTCKEYVCKIPVTCKCENIVPNENADIFINEFSELQRKRPW